MAADRFSVLGTPRRCPVDDAPHTTCTSPDYGQPIVVVQLPCRDGVTPAAVSIPVSRPGPLRADAVQATVPPGQFTSGTYRRKKT
jgi:hypothetical protein